MVERKLELFAAVVALWTLVTLLLKPIRILLRWKYIEDKNYAILVNAKLFCLKRFVPVTRAEVFIKENIFSRKTKLSVTGPAWLLI